MPSKTKVNLHDAWQWDSGFAFIATGIGFAGVTGVTGVTA